MKFAQDEQIDGVLTAATDYGVLTASYIAENMGLPGLNYETAKLIKNKFLVRKCLYANHVDDTEQTYEITVKTDIKELSSKLSYPVMVKPCDGSGSRGASRVDSAEQLEAACQYAMEESITHRAEIETFIIGNEYGAESLVVNGEVHVLGIMKKWMTEPPYYAELGHAMPSGLDIDIENRVRKCVKKAIIALGVNHGSVNMDMIISNTGKIHIIDIGARMGGNMIGPCIIPYGVGVDYIGNVLKAAVNEPTNFNVFGKCAVATKLLAFNGGIVKELPDFEQIEDKYDVEIFHHIQKGDVVNEYHTNLDGLGYVIARADSVENAEKKAIAALTMIKKIIF